MGVRTRELLGARMREPLGARRRTRRMEVRGVKVTREEAKSRRNQRRCLQRKERYQRLKPLPRNRQGQLVVVAVVE